MLFPFFLRLASRSDCSVGMLLGRKFAFPLQKKGKVAAGATTQFANAKYSMLFGAGLRGVCLICEFLRDDRGQSPQKAESGFKSGLN